MENLNNFANAYESTHIYYHDNKIILNWYSKRIISTSSVADAVLDLGIGHGFCASNFSNFFQDYTVIEGSSEIIKKFSQVSNGKTVNLFFEDFEIDKKYDLIIMGFILEHVDDPVFILKKYKEFLKKDGKIIIAVLNAECLNRRIGNYAHLLDNVFQLSKADYEQGHKRFYSVETLKRDIESANLQCNCLEGIYMKPLTAMQMISLNLSDDIINAFCEVGVAYPELSLGIMGYLTR